MNLAVNARDAMPHGGTLTIDDRATSTLDEPYAPTHAGAAAGPVRAARGHATPASGMDEATPAAHLRALLHHQGRPARARGSAWRPSTASSSRAAATSRSTASPGAARRSRVYLPARWRSRRSGPARGGTACVPRNRNHPGRRGRGRCSFAGRGDPRAGRYNVFSARNSQEAEAAFQESGRDFALLLTDVIMPGGSGPDLHRRLSASRSPLPVLYMSGYTGHVTVDQRRLETGAPFLQKPFDADVLLRAVRRAMNG